MNLPSTLLSSFIPTSFEKYIKTWSCGWPCFQWGIMLRAGEGKKHKVLKRRVLLNRRGLLPSHSHPHKCCTSRCAFPSVGTAEVELISTVFREKVLAPDLDVALPLSSSHSMTGGVGDSFSAVFQHKKPHGNKFLTSVVCFPLPLCEIAPKEQSVIYHGREKGRS